MAHKVTFALPERELGKADIVILVKRDRAVLGKLLVSKGAIVWRSKGKSKRGKKLGWQRFAELMEAHGRRE